VIDSVQLLPSWRPGATRDALVGFLASAESLPVDQRVAAFDNDGTLWCERPTFVQYDFFAHALAEAAVNDHAVHERPEYAAVLANDAAAIAEIGLVRVALALAELFSGVEPDEFTRRSRDFVDSGRHRVLGMPLRLTVYQPMRELLDELRRREFTIFIVTGGGSEFVRAISLDLYGVPPEAVVGTSIAYDFSRDAAGKPVLRRTSQVAGAANEGAAKVAHIQTQLGRRPILGVGNSGGDREMMEWACTGNGPGLALLVDHDDAEREFRYAGTAATFDEDEDILAVAARLGWTVVSMANDWDVVFAGAASPSG
jgi:phosphoglycolate phosphatase-like HAD superfamily hydrolase